MTAIEPERILGVAIWHADYYGRLPAPARHHDVIRDLVGSGKTQRVGGDAWQGFYTNNRRFVSSMAAFVIAERAGQIIKHTGPAGFLFSEDLW
jgi:hypothetical protein